MLYILYYSSTTSLQSNNIVDTIYKEYNSEICAILRLAGVLLANLVAGLLLKSMGLAGLF